MNKTSVKMMIPTKIGQCSLVGIIGEFPRGYGNYISTYTGEYIDGYIDGYIIHFYIVNLGCEDLEDAIELGLISNEMEADVYKVDDKTYVAYVTDTRLPEKALGCEYWYDHRSTFKNEIMRKKYNYDSDKCMCSDSKYTLQMLGGYGINYDTRLIKGSCSVCKISHTIKLTEY